MVYQYCLVMCIYASWAQDPYGNIYSPYSSGGTEKRSGVREGGDRELGRRGGRGDMEAGKIESGAGKIPSQFIFKSSELRERVISLGRGLATCRFRC